MVWPLAWVVILGTLPGVLIGAVVRVSGLRDPRHFKLFAAAVILYIAVKMVVDLLKQQRGSRSAALGAVATTPPPSPPVGCSSMTTVAVTSRSWQRICLRFQERSYDFSVIGVFVLCFVVGIIGGIYGIGGGAIIAPFLMTFFGLPVHIVAGSALMGTFVTSVAGVAFYSAIAPLYPQLSVAPDWLLGFLFGLGGMVGMYCGARCQKYVPAILIKWMLVVIMLGTSIKYLLEYMQ